MKYEKEHQLLSAVMPQWHYRIARPFKQLRESGITPEVCHCLMTLLWQGDGITMTELARLAGMSRQQTTKVVDRLIRGGFAERENDPNDRRVIRLRTTAYAREYMEQFQQNRAEYYESMFEDMGREDRAAFCGAMETLRDIFSRLPNGGCCREEDRSMSAGKGGEEC
ncbi:MAG: MarR family transcriptional regulator [Oscillospiraceae bacterium]|nr:MarR family transcriptional regulator [Oscillospiraceae bacterium]